MIRNRSKLARRDRESGLTFSWRQPLSSGGSFLLAVVVVSLMSVGLAGLVRVRIGERDRKELRKGSVVVVPDAGGGRSLDLFAIEAGPFPARWNPAADPGYAALRGAALKQAHEGGYSYRPEVLVFEAIEEPIQPDQGVVNVLPRLPDAAAPIPDGEQRDTSLGVRMLRSGDGPELQVPALPMDAAEAAGSVGRRFLIGHGPDGRTFDVTPLDSAASPPALLDWLNRARVKGGGKDGGWLVVETCIAP